MLFADMLRDSLRESLDRRTFHITLGAFAILILLCASIGFERHSMERTIQEFMVGHEYRTRHPSLQPLEFRVREVRPAGSDGGVSEFAGGWEFRLDVGPPDRLQKAVVAWRPLPAGEKTYAVKLRDRRVPGLSADFTTILERPSLEEMDQFIEWTVRTVPDATIPVRAVLEERGSQSFTFRVWFVPLNSNWLLRGHDVKVLLGAWTVERPFVEIRDSVFFIQELMAGYIVGWVGILVSIVVTSAFIPNMLQNGMLDLILSRPVQRSSVLLMKFLGGFTSIFAASTFLVGGCWIVMGLRSGTWAPGFLLAIPLLLFFFAALYSVSTVIGVVSRNATQAIMASVLAWLALTSLGRIQAEVPKPEETGADVFGFLVRTVHWAHTVLPPLKEIDKATTVCLLRANGIPPGQVQRLPFERAGYPEVAWGPLFGVTGAWMVGLLGLSCWMFSRRDY